MARKQITDRQILAQLPSARKRSTRSLKREPHAKEARYDRARDVIHVILTNGAGFEVPLSRLRALRGASPDVLDEVRVGPAGLGLHWESLDVDLSVLRLAELVFGRAVLLRAAAAAGGSTRSAAKAKAAQANGLKGGRPRVQRGVASAKRSATERGGMHGKSRPR
jgi:hypothetical protein